MTYTANNAQELAEALKKDPVIAITNDFKLIKLNIEWSELTDRPTVIDTDIDYIMVMSLSNIMNFYSGIAEYLKDNPNLAIIN